MPTPKQRTKDAAESKSAAEKRRQEIRAAVIKYADGERTREDVMRISGAGKKILSNLTKELGLKFGRAW